MTLTSAAEARNPAVRKTVRMRACYQARPALHVPGGGKSRSPVLPLLAGDRVPLMKSKVLLVVVVVAAIGLGVAVGPIVWEWATTRCEWHLEKGLALTGPPQSETPMLIRMHRQKGSGRPVRLEAWYVEGGHRAAVSSKKGRNTAVVVYRPDGTPLSMHVAGPLQQSPPWLGQIVDPAVGRDVMKGITQEDVPSAPWLRAGITPAEFWEQVKPEGEPTLEEFLSTRQGQR